MEAGAKVVVERRRKWLKSQEWHDLVYTSGGGMGRVNGGGTVEVAYCGRIIILGTGTGSGWHEADPEGVKVEGKEAGVVLDVSVARYRYSHQFLLFRYVKLLTLLVPVVQDSVSICRAVGFNGHGKQLFHFAPCSDFFLDTGTVKKWEGWD